MKPRQSLERCSHVGKMLIVKALGPGFDPQNPHEGRRRGQTPPNSSLTTTCVTYIYLTYTQ